MVFVPAGEFAMGRDEGVGDERPVHAVYLDGFYVDKTEVTNAQFARFLNELGNQEEDGATWLNVEDEACPIAEVEGQYQPKNGYANHPVVEVTWHGAVAYCEWAGRRLPTEAEWEKAARGTDARTYPWGEGIDCDRANYGGCAGEAIEVASLPSGASPYGALDMAGNVYEWVLDWYDRVYYITSPGSNPQGPGLGSYRGIRGGSWVNGEKRVGAATRFSNVPANPLNNVGFRCARSDSEP
jgi:formylglycine-generating enzyme required for sulfatase activity